jgi:hypothetical protein
MVNGSNFWEWFHAIRKRSVIILAGGIAVLTALYEHWKGENMSWNWSFTIAVIGGYWACFLVWKEQAIELRKARQEHLADAAKWNQDGKKETDRIAAIARTKKTEGQYGLRRVCLQSP